LSSGTSLSFDLQDDVDIDVMTDDSEGAAQDPLRPNRVLSSVTEVPVSDTSKNIFSCELCTFECKGVQDIIKHHTLFHSMKNTKESPCISTAKKVLCIPHPPSVVVQEQSAVVSYS